MIIAAETFCINLVDIFGSRRPRGEPAVLCYDFDPAERPIIARSAREFHLYPFAAEFPYIELLRGGLEEMSFFFSRSGRVDSLIEGFSQIARSRFVDLVRVMTGSRGNFGSQETHDESVLVRRPYRTVAAEERSAGTFFAAEAQRSIDEPIAEPFESDRHLYEFTPQLSGHPINHRA